MPLSPEQRPSRSQGLHYPEIYIERHSRPTVKCDSIPADKHEVNPSFQQALYHVTIVFIEKMFVH